MSDVLIRAMRSIREGKITLMSDKTIMVQLEIKGDVKIMDIHNFSFEEPGNDNIFGKLSKARDLGNNLKNNSQTLVIRHKGNDVMKFGKEARPKLSILATMSRDVEISDLFELRKLSKLGDPEK